MHAASRHWLPGATWIAWIAIANKCISTQLWFAYMSMHVQCNRCICNHPCTSFALMHTTKRQKLLDAMKIFASLSVQVGRSRTVWLNLPWTRNLKGGIGSFFHPCVNAMEQGPYWLWRMEVCYCTFGFSTIIQCNLCTLLLPQDNLYACMIFSPLRRFTLNETAWRAQLWKNPELHVQ